MEQIKQFHVLISSFWSEPFPRIICLFSGSTLGLSFTSEALNSQLLGALLPKLRLYYSLSPLLTSYIYN